MEDKFKGKYRIPSARLQNWDYGSEGAYFITICTKHHLPYFGAIENGKMRYSPVGAMAYVLWHELQHRILGIELGGFVVMPNHLHGIIMITESAVGNNFIVKNDTTVETRHALSLQTDENDATVGKQRFQNQGKNTISSIVGGYKSALTKYANRLELEFAWQPRFHDHIIRDEKVFQRSANISLIIR